MRVLIACESSGVSRRAFRARGHDAWSVDLLEADDGSPFHHQGDLREMVYCVRPNGRPAWDLAIFHLPCTYFTNAGVRWLFRDSRSNGRSLTRANRNEKRWREMKAAEALWRECQALPIARMAFENPIPHAHVDLGDWPRQIIQPWQFGHMETKATCLWLKGLPPLVETKNVYREMMRLPKRERERIHRLPPGPDRWKERSKTFDGIGEAMAAQWGGEAAAVQAAA